MPIAKFESLDIYNLKNLDYKMWYSIKTEGEKNKPLYENENEDYYLSENDIIKIGQRKYEVIKLKIIPKDNSDKNNNKFGTVFYLPEINVRPGVDKLKETEKGKKQQNDHGFNTETDCRVCYGPIFEDNNPLLKICKCNTYIHYDCLKKFLKERITIIENLDKTVTLYSCENFSCEVCQEPYPLKFQIDKRDITIYCLIDGLELPESTNYMILESLTNIHFDEKDKKKKNIKNIFVVKLTDKEISIGRCEQNDIIDNDSSISRFHAVLKFDEKKGKVKLVNKGKFGTLVLIKKNVKLEIGQKIYLQLGNTYVKAEVKEDDSKEEDSENEGSSLSNSKSTRSYKDSSDPNKTIVANW